MSESQEKTSSAYDPFEPFRAVRDAYLDAMAKAMVESVNSEAYAQATGSMLENYLSAVAPVREALDKSMLQALEKLSLPSRQEVAALAERFTNVEMRLDDMDAKLDDIHRALDRNGFGPEATDRKRAGTAGGAKANPGGNTEAATRARPMRPPLRRRRERKHR